MSYQLLIIISVILCYDLVTSLELIEIRVPTFMPIGIRPALMCRWVLGPRDELYSVKWYKDGKEFFRHEPKDQQPYRIFPIQGVDVEVSNASGSNLTLTPAVLATSGRYRCEVSGERPQFHTVSQFADMNIVALPLQGPRILGLKCHYRVGHYVNVTCSLEQSNSLMKLTWYINEKPASPNSTAQQVYVDEEDNMTTSLKIEFPVVEGLVGNLTFQCRAIINSVNWRSVEKTAIVSETLEDKEGHTLRDSRILAYPKYAKSKQNTTITFIYRLEFYSFVIFILIASN